MLIDRPALAARIRDAFAVHPVVTLAGPRQCGKTTLARAIAAHESRSTYFDLEAAVDRRRLETPEQTLGRLEGLVVVDEVQRAPTLYETLRVLVDRPGQGAAVPAARKRVARADEGRVGITCRPRGAG